MQNKQKAIVFGGAGFIGSHVCDELSNRGYAVTIFDVKNSPYLREDQQTIVGDMLDEKVVNDAVKGVDYIFNFAGIADIEECAEKPVEAVKYNVLGNVILLEAAKNNNIKRFVFASSAYVYSDAGAFYKNTKQACELFIDTYQKRFGLEYTILRYGSLYGPRSDARNSIYKMLKNALDKKEIIYRGTGDEMREFIHVKDAAQLTVDILKEEFKNQYLVLTGQHPMKYKDLLSMINEMLNNSVNIKMLENTSDTHYKITPYNFSPKVGRKLVSNPYTDMGQGMLEMMQEIHGKFQENQ